MPNTSPQLHISYGPHIRAGDSTTSIMWTVNMALVPALIWAVIIFGLQPLFITLTAILGCASGEALMNHLQKRRWTIFDGSAVCSGILLAFTLPPALPVWMPFLGGFLAILLAKGLFGGLGYNLFNVALIARAMLMGAYPVAMTTKWLAPRFGSLDAVTTATPLAVMKEKGVLAAMDLINLAPTQLSYFSKMVLGLRPGSIGEVSVVCIVLGGLFLIYKGIIKWTIPLSVLAGLLLTTVFTEGPIIHAFGGGIWLAAFFMATDYVTSPTTTPGQIIFGVGVGILSGVIRRFGGYPEGACYAILLMNILTPALNDWFRPQRVDAKGVPS